MNPLKLGVKFELSKQRLLLKLILLMAYLVEGEVATATSSTRVSVQRKQQTD